MKWGCLKMENTLVEHEIHQSVSTKILKKYDLKKNIMQSKTNDKQKPRTMFVKSVRNPPNKMEFAYTCIRWAHMTYWHSYKLSHTHTQIDR